MSQSKTVYLGRMTVIAPTSVASGGAQDLAGGEASPSLAGWTLKHISCRVVTAPTITGSATIQLRTGNNVAVTAAYAGNSSPTTDALIATKHVTMNANDLASAWDVLVGGSSTSVDSGVLDFYGEFVAPRA
jgi:hypothetical protein